MKADNPVMTSLFYRRISVPSAPIGGSRLYGATIGGECIWRIALKTAYDTCLPVSALGTLLHRRPDAAEKNNLEATFKTLESAYATRIVPCYFNRTLLIAFGLREVLGLSTPIKDPEHALESIFQIIQNRKYFVGPKIFGCSRPIKNEAFVLILHRPNETSQHAITITCDGLWAGGKGFGFQDTQYNNNTIERYWKKSETLDDFHQEFFAYLTQYNYTNATIQMLCLEDIR